MSTFRGFRKIKQYKDIIKGLISSYQFEGLDESGEPIYNKHVKLPTISLHGTVKLHGTNAGIHYSKETGEVTPQKRTSSCGGEYGHFGFVEWVHTNKNILKTLCENICKEKVIDEVWVYGEWCGQGVQKKVGISKLTKRFVVFASHDGYNYMSPSTFEYFDKPEINLFNIYNYKTYEVDVDLNHPNIALGLFDKIVEEVENDCPVSKHMMEKEGVVNGGDNIGEGVVFSVWINDMFHTMKVKGEKHSKSSGGSKKATVDPIKAENVKDFVDKVVTENRLEQCYDEVCSNKGHEPTNKDLGDLIRWMIRDIHSEEGDALQFNNLTEKDVNSSISNKSRVWFMEKLNQF